jgi:hypothetical protein
MDASGRRRRIAQTPRDQFVGLGGFGHFAKQSDDFACFGPAGFVAEVLSF